MSNVFSIPNVIPWSAIGFFGVTNNGHRDACSALAKTGAIVSKTVMLNANKAKSLAVMSGDPYCDRRALAMVFAEAGLTLCDGRNDVERLITHSDTVM